MSGRGSSEGLNSKKGQAFIDEFLDEKNMTVKESHDVVLVLMKSEEMDVIVDDIILGEQKKLNPTIVVEDHSSYYWIKAQGQIVIDVDVAAEIMGRQYNVYDFLVNVSSTVGRAFINGNVFTLTTELVGLDKELA
ncbi:putative BmoB (butane monooxygenase regulatory protein B) protein [Methylocella tundrae]|uniref:Putative BmoB (Butane monooxygenase regulatory protein B) protein n=1 Tax=Methylocella tundrae TaxID=227605 RepID=A0A8B6MAG9_METTU|nr:MmoB/DmpM family protein [Methylocella tundrae]VTZ27608.1 putative BmoB (butane monooxygenase regulatory protein B) protein [Methylocella tundrae]VTZ51289.1 putative BmoB (butane monooxygenase regulatory protein B) protein [Methylocella tundrae]